MGAEVPMQFEPATSAEYAVKVDPSRPLTPYDPADAIFTVALMLCADGATAAGLRRVREDSLCAGHRRGRGYRRFHGSRTA